jgi:hypothetical protein
MVADYQKLVGWPEVEEIAAHEPAGEFVASRQIDLRFVPSPAFLGLVGDDEAGAFELGDFGWVPIDPAFQEHFHGRRDGIIVEDTGDRRDEHALAVGACAEQEHEHMRIDVAGEAITEEPLQEADQLGVAIGDAFEEFEIAGTAFRARRAPQRSPWCSSPRGGPGG